MARNVQILAGRPKTQRRTRKPETKFSLRHRPWQICPFCIFPVLPGETLKMGMWQSRVVTDPLANPLMGGHIEYYYYYVKLRDIEGIAEAVNDMILDPAYDSVALRSAASAPYFHRYGINWMKLATDQAIRDHFRAHDEDASDYMIGDYPAASIRDDSWLDSAMRESDYAPPGQVDVDINADGNITVEEIRQAQRAYDLARTMNMIDMSFEDYLTTYGVNIPQENDNITEELRYVRNWAYPTNTVDPATGVPTTALSWAVAERLDKDRYFREMGFVVGVTVFRPKVYMSNVGGSLTGIMDSVYKWLPAILNDDPDTSFMHIDDPANGPLANQTEGYWFDLKDLLLYGEQYVNYALGTPGNNHIAMPSAGLQKYYPTAAMADSVFAKAEKNLVRQDGIVSLTVLGSTVDHTPSVVPPNV